MPCWSLPCIKHQSPSQTAVSASLQSLLVAPDMLSGSKADRQVLEKAIYRCNNPKYVIVQG